MLEKISIFPDEIKARNKVAQIYSDKLHDYFDVPFIEDFCTSVWAKYTLKTKEEKREKVINSLREEGIPCVVYYPTPLHMQTAYKKYPIMPQGLPISELISKQVFSLPMHPYLSRKDQDIIISTLIKNCG